MIVENRVGAGTIIGTQYVSRAPADGYTLLFTSYAFTSNPELRKNLPYSPSAFRPVALLARRTTSCWSTTSSRASR